MSSSFITTLKNAQLLMRSIASMVIIAHFMLITTPAVAAVTTESAKQSATEVSAEQALSTDLATAIEKLALLAELRQDNKNTDAVLTELSTLKSRIESLDKRVLENFSTIKNTLEEKQLPDIILQRHTDRVAHYNSQNQALMALLDKETATSLVASLARSFNTLVSDDQALPTEARLNTISDGQNTFSSHDFKRSQQAFDPNDLPNQILQADKNNKPKTTREDFIHSGLSNSPQIQLAALGDFSFDQLSEASNPAYLSATDEINLTQIIKDKAADLNYDPIEIHNWVRNNIEWQPTWGAIQNAELTLSAQRGNAMDIASLTIALLRAAKIPARYVHGTLDIAAEKFNNWAGGFDNATAATTFASAGGIPITSVISGGQITTIRMEHIWVEAAIDYFPSRGVINKEADSWVAMDPSYKQYDYQQGLDVIQISGIDPEQLAQSFIDSGTVNEAESWVTGFDASLLQSAQAEAQQKLELYIQDNLPDPTVGEVIGGRKAIIKEYPILPSSLPNPIQVIGNHYDKLPGELQQTISWAFSKDLFGNPDDPVSYPFATVNNQKITLSFKPATEADEQALLSLLPEGEITDLTQLPGSIPSYLINVLPELKLNGQIIKTGNAITLGEEIDFITDTQFAGRGALQSPRTYKVIAGSYLAVNAYAGSVSPQRLQQAQSQLENTRTILETADPNQLSALTRQELLGDLFYAGGLGYYAQFTALSHIMGLQAGTHPTLAAGTGTFGYEPIVEYFFGFPRSIKPGGVVFDIPIVNINGINDGDSEKLTQFALQTGILSSTLEHAVPEQMFVDEDNPGEAISAVKALQKASEQGQRIYHINKDNQSAILDNIHHDQETMIEISNALNAGKEVITHTDAVSVPGWTGAGYIIIDPLTGAGAYKISGGGNGGNLAAESVGLIAVSILALIALVGTMTTYILVYFIVAALALGIALFTAELLQDSDQFWEEKGQITAIVSFALSPLGGAGIIAPAGVQALLLQIVLTIIGVTGAI